jgi:predicted esterase
MEERQVQFSFTGHYFMTGAPNENTKQIWFVLHGYGQLAKYFAKKFSVLASRQICVIAPEGLSNYYIDSFQPRTGRSNDRVGASWMTRENRLMDIGNYMTYLDEVYRVVMADYNLPVTILGFSQGSATASRWALSKRIKFERLILWAGMFPSDMDFENGREILKDKTCMAVYGTKDPYLTDAGFAEMKHLSSEVGVEMNVIQFEGGHDIDEETLLKLV